MTTKTQKQWQLTVYFDHSDDVCSVEDYASHAEMMRRLSDLLAVGYRVLAGMVETSADDSEGVPANGPGREPFPTTADMIPCQRCGKPCWSSPCGCQDHAIDLHAGPAVATVKRCSVCRKAIDWDDDDTGLPHQYKCAECV